MAVLGCWSAALCVRMQGRIEHENMYKLSSKEKECWVHRTLWRRENWKFDVPNLPRKRKNNTATSKKSHSEYCEKSLMKYPYKYEKVSGGVRIHATPEISTQLFLIIYRQWARLGIWWLREFVVQFLCLYRWAPFALHTVVFNYLQHLTKPDNKSRIILSKCGHLLIASKPQTPFETIHL